jgi:Flp pilus assembly pilin Flp
MKKSKESGQGLTEYAVLVSVIAVASIAVTALFGAALKSKIASLGAAIAGKSSSDVTAFEKQAQQKADAARKAAEDVDGMQVSEKEIAPEGARAGK